MPASVMQGDPVEFVIPTGILNGLTGKNLILPSATWLALVSGHVQITTTATVGTRQFEIEALDPAGNVLFESTNPTLQPASTSFRYSIGAGLPIVAASAILTWPIPYPVFLPPGSTIKIFDQAAIDVNDNISQPAPFVFTQ